MQAWNLIWKREVRWCFEEFGGGFWEKFRGDERKVVKNYPGKHSLYFIEAGLYFGEP